MATFDGLYILPDTHEGMSFMFLNMTERICIGDVQICFHPHLDQVLVQSYFKVNYNDMKKQYGPLVAKWCKVLIKFKKYLVLMHGTNYPKYHELAPDNFFNSLKEENVSTESYDRSHAVQCK